MKVSVGHLAAGSTVFFTILKYSAFARAAPCLYPDLWEATQNYLGLRP